MDLTTRMTQLLGAMRRERNGAVADAMRYVGAAYGLNYGVSLPTVRRLARDCERDEALARYLYGQDVRELKLAAFWIADPAHLDLQGASFWAAGLVNSELAEEFAFALLSRTTHFPEIYPVWIGSEATQMQCYAALMGASRRSADELAGLMQGVADVVRCNPNDRLVARGVVALIEACCDAVPQREPLARLIEQIGDSPAAKFIREEVSWRLEY